MHQSFETPPWYSAVQTTVPCVESAVTDFLKSPPQTLKSISKRRKHERELPKYFMSNIQITECRKNATTDKLNVNTPLIHEEVPPPTTSSRVKIRLQKSESECSPHPPGNTSWGDYPHFPLGVPGVGVSNDLYMYGWQNLILHISRLWCPHHMHSVTSAWPVF